MLRFTRRQTPFVSLTLPTKVPRNRPKMQKTKTLVMSIIVLVGVGTLVTLFQKSYNLWPRLAIASISPVERTQIQLMDNLFHRKQTSETKNDDDDLVVCVAWFAYGGNSYHNEVRENIPRIRSRAAGIHTFLVTDKPELYRSIGLVQKVVLLPTDFRTREGLVNKFLPRGAVIANWETLAPMCDVTIMIDSSTEYCGTDDPFRLRNQLIDLYHQQSFEIAANVEHAPYPRWNSTPFVTPRALNEHLYSALPHGFAIAWKGHSAKSILLRHQWVDLMRFGGKAYHRDDQVALRDVMLKNGPLYRLSDALATDYHSVQKLKYGVFPRFTYVLEGYVSLLHTHSSANIPPQFDGQMCQFINSDKRKRIVWLDSPQSSYQMVFSWAECTVLESQMSVLPSCSQKYPDWECKPEQPYICRESFPLKGQKL